MRCACLWPSDGFLRAGLLRHVQDLEDSLRNLTGLDDAVLPGALGVAPAELTPDIAEAMDLGGLFLGMSFFLILASLVLTALLRLTGGPSNPFSVLYLVYIDLAAVTLGAAWTWSLALLSTR